MNIPSYPARVLRLGLARARQAKNNPLIKTRARLFPVDDDDDGGIVPADITAIKQQEEYYALGILKRPLRTGLINFSRYHQDGIKLRVKNFIINAFKVNAMATDAISPLSPPVLFLIPPHTLFQRR